MQNLRRTSCHSYHRNCTTAIFCSSSFRTSIESTSRARRTSRKCSITYLEDKSARVHRPSNIFAQNRKFSSRWWPATSTKRSHWIAARCYESVRDMRRWLRSCCTRRSSSTFSSTSRCPLLILHQMHFPHSRWVVGRPSESRLVNSNENIF